MLFIYQVAIYSEGDYEALSPLEPNLIGISASTSHILLNR